MSTFAHRGASLNGRVQVPGDKSISHRSLIFGALAQGVTQVRGLLEAEDVLHTAAALRALGVSIERDESADGPVWTIEGAPWQAPDRILYAGNSGTGVRLLMGAVAGQGVEAVFDGDASLRKRPMGRIIEPLAQMGASSDSDDGRLPVKIAGGKLTGMRYRLPKPSAQIKSAILLAALGADGETIIEEPVLSRDHTERMLSAFGAEISFGPLEGAEATRGRTIHLKGGQTLKACDITVPADPSSAAFPLVAALIVPGSEVTVEGVLMNPQRTGLYQTLIEMGADLTFANERTLAGETLADITARHSALKGVSVPAGRAPSMIDEYPILSIAAACATGETRMEGLEELRVKESDRLSAVAAGLAGNRVSIVEGPDWLTVTGSGGEPLKGGDMVSTHMDHRIAMSFLVMGLVSADPVGVDSTEMIATSFPEFLTLMKTLGADIRAER
ncbi:3-phosphoshikimate 1-carboxyvinyltransferase [Aquisalinus flavus]|uniref:3-phosphoshikimate 1-carboxyvinyltransferase n=1 Tax=Aquisalinus flavus TaxID=1526572 RepID=A0A8J2V389_9PROT|nr:3-phosphoshikimate 1-carboxyvinyltransferase [Aquisalinus flavus]MBD0425835.1 3-phosphoshikimate 1-carboxyvinyltransferase [Aquisalinus flavus]UNE48562.1 3-phosphoshikimate 1-carboxyvinyltransferase [Aquisalinus flavus]GGD12873.1 3-phosphoshikimate 1-carboxyvinyltransferase [Aquisalinus flavus]